MPSAVPLCPPGLERSRKLVIRVRRGIDMSGLQVCGFRLDLQSFLRRFAWSYLNSAGQTSFVMMQQINYNSRDIVGLQLPALLGAWCVSPKLGINRTRHNVTYLDSVVTDFLHQSLTETVKSKL